MPQPLPTVPRTRVALYMRVSTDIQANKDEGSLDTQEARLRSAIDARQHPCEIRHVFREEGESGKSLDRPALQRMLAAVRAREVDLIVVTRVDRLSRSLLDFYEVNELFEKNGVEFVSLNEAFDTSSAVGRAMLRLILVFAQLEREQTSERTIIAMKARAERGLWNGGHPPLGYDSQGNGHLDTNAAEAELVKLIFGQYLELRSTVKLAAWLNDHGYRQKTFNSRRKGSAGGKPFSIPVLQGMLANRLYLGEIEHKGQVFKGQHEAIILPGIFERVRHIMADNDKNLRVAPERAKYDYLLTGRLRCACGYSLTTSAGRAKGKSYHYYRCVGLQKKDRHECPVRQVRADAADAAVLSIVRDTARNPKLLEEAVAEANRLARQTVDPLRERVSALKKEVAATERVAEQLFDAMLAAGASSSSTGKRRLAETEEKAQQLRRALAEAEGELAVKETEQLDAEVVVQALGSFDEAFDHLSLDEKREFLRLMIKQVIVHKDRVIVDLYEGRQATKFLVAFATGGGSGSGGTGGSVGAEPKLSDSSAQKQQNPGVDRGFVNDTKWLPLLDVTRTICFRPSRETQWTYKVLSSVSPGAEEGAAGA